VDERRKPRDFRNAEGIFSRSGEGVD